MRNPALRGPERHAIVKCADELILELQSPIRAAVDGFVNAKIGGIVANRHQIGNFVADSLHIAKLQRLGTGTTPPSSPCHRRSSSRMSRHARGPHHALIYWLTAINPWVVPLFCGVNFG